MTQEPFFEESSGNAFADLEQEDTDELFTRGKIGSQVICILKQRNLTLFCHSGKLKMRAKFSTVDRARI